MRKLYKNDRLYRLHTYARRHRKRDASRPAPPRRRRGARTIPAGHSLIDLADRRIAFADGRPPEELGDDTAATTAAMGASDHHFLGADRHLRDILTFFGALVAPVSVYLTSRDFDDGVPSARAEQEVDALLRTTAGLAAAGVHGAVTPLAARGRP
jgi:hypothetical protein